MKQKKYAVLLAVMLSLVLWLLPAAAEESVCILFTHDMHSHLAPQMENGGTRGGFARL